MSRSTPQPPDWHEEENIPNPLDRPSGRLKAMLAQARQEFLSGLRDIREDKKMHDEVAYYYEMYEAEEIDKHEFVVCMLEVLNTYATPLTGSIMDKYGISDFELFPEDFTRVCVDFVHQKLKERMVVDLDSIDNDDFNSFPMSRKEIGDELKGTLQIREDGLPYIEGHKDEYVYQFVLDDALRSRAADCAGRKIEAKIEKGEVVDFSFTA